jgi:hypothetical protein
MKQSHFRLRSDLQWIIHYGPNKQAIKVTQAQQAKQTCDDEPSKSKQRTSQGKQAKLDTQASRKQYQQYKPSMAKQRTLPAKQAKQATVASRKQHKQRKQSGPSKLANTGQAGQSKGRCKQSWPHKQVASNTGRRSQAIAASKALARKSTRWLTLLLASLDFQVSWLLDFLIC